jgi:YVTN family beta-propeller protein
VAFGAGSVWVTGTDQTLIRIDPRSGLKTNSIPVEHDLGAVSASDDAVWTNEYIPVDIALHIDPATNKIVRGGRVHVGPGSDGFAIGEGAVWVFNVLGHNVMRIDPKSNTVTDKIPVGGQPWWIEIGFGAVWVTTPETGDLVRIDPTTHETEHIQVGLKATLPKVCGVYEMPVAAGSDALWVANTGRGEIDRVDPITHEVTRYHVGFSPLGIAAAYGSVWVSLWPSDRSLLQEECRPAAS